MAGLLVLAGAALLGAIAGWQARALRAQPAERRWHALRGELAAAWWSLTALRRTAQALEHGERITGLHVLVTDAYGDHAVYGSDAAHPWPAKAVAQFDRPDDGRLLVELAPMTMPGSPEEVTGR